MKWAGGKRWLVPHLLEYWHGNEQKRLVEPLCGGLAVTLGLMPARALLNDINPHSINFYRWLRKGLKVNVSMENDASLFYRHRRRFNDLIADGGMRSKEAAELFYYLNRTDYNGLCRFNSKGEFNVPFGRYKTISYAKDFLSYKKTFKSWIFSDGDFEKIDLDRNDFVYVDPPYDVEFTKYTKEDFKWDDQVRLMEWLSHHKGMVIVSNQATDRIKKLYRKCGFKLRTLDAPRMINCTGDRTPAREVIAIKGF